MLQSVGCNESVTALSTWLPCILLEVKGSTSKAESTHFAFLIRSKRQVLRVKNNEELSP